MPKKIEFSEEQQKEIVRRYLGGESVKSISATYEVSDPTIKNVLTGNNIRIRTNSEVQRILENKGGGQNRIEVPEDIKSRIAGLYNERHSIKKISEETGLGDSVIKRILKERGSLRTSGESLTRIFKEEEESEIIRLYLGGCSAQEIGRRFSVGNGTIIRLLRSRGVRIRRIGESTKKLDYNKELDITSKYLEGNSKTSLAAEYGVSTPTITRILRDHKASRDKSENKNNRSRGVSQPRLVKTKDIRLMMEMYAEGLTMVEIGRRFGIRDCTVRRYLIREGVSLRSLSEAKGGLNKEEENEAIKRYLSGENSVDIAKSFNKNYNTILAMLRRNGIETRSVGEAISAKYEMELDANDICRRYQGGETAHEIAKSLSVGYAGIYSLLRRNNVQIRTKQESQIHRFEKNLDVDDICSRYLGGESANAIAEDYPISNDGILNLLRRQGIEVRDRPDGGDSIRHLLDGRGRFSSPRETWYYIYTVKGYAGLLKPGISHNHRERARLSKGRYQECVFEVLYETRVKCYLMEQAILKATVNFAEYPEELILEDWQGINELRRVPLEDLIATFEFYSSELEDLGQWKFAVNYVSMTEGERQECLRRSEIE